ncbi:hypothetical protein [Neptuniibacter sp. UBA847]|uniref:hypothetical protein n=1 Tax=Neptuniibacter sp. UBA847 TaxID=1946977 RepID=UPI0025E0A266|nr:hypothetical protein [Neptuniibacter sp. UBA847]|tara:strand:+ start:1943 stop:2518 length:576 start_codon:yes stop_codon:yes gene_type:complete
MSTQTILHKESPLVAAFTEAGAGLSDLMLNHYVSNYTLSDVQQRTETALEATPIDINPIIPEDAETPVPAIVFDAVTHNPQFLTTSNYRALKAQQPELFNPPIVEPDPEPRYKRVMTSSEFVRDVLTREEVARIGQLQATDPTVWAWAYITSAGNVSVDHDNFAPGIALGIDRGVWNTERAAEISKGLLIV